MIDLTDLQFAGLMLVVLLAVLGVDTIAQARQERRIAERRAALKRELRRRSIEERTEWDVEVWR